MIQRKSKPSSFDHLDRQGLQPLKACIGLDLMHLFWDKHLELGGNVVIALAKIRGCQFNCAEGIPLTMLAADLLSHELKASAMPSSMA